VVRVACPATPPLQHNSSTNSMKPEVPIYTYLNQPLPTQQHDPYQYLQEQSPQNQYQYKQKIHQPPKVTAPAMAKSPRNNGLFHPSDEAREWCNICSYRLWRCVSKLSEHFDNLKYVCFCEGSICTQGPDWISK
jgi:hypothetical protein